MGNINTAPPARDSSIVPWTWDDVIYQTPKDAAADVSS
jgi:hypothetical protein